MPYTLYERVPGETLGLLDLEPEATPHVWRALGRDLARLHTLITEADLPQGHREIAPLDGDETTEARILWRHLQIAIRLMRRDPQPTHSWAERPLAMFLEIMRFLLESSDPRWRAYLPNT